MDTRNACTTREDSVDVDFVRQEGGVNRDMLELDCHLLASVNIDTFPISFEFVLLAFVPR